MSKPVEIIRNLISLDKLEDAITQLDVMDKDLCALLQRELKQIEMDFVRGFFKQEKRLILRSRLAHRVLAYLAICTETTQPPPDELPSQPPDIEQKEASEPQKFLLPIEKTLIRQHLEKQQTIPMESPKIMTYYFLERKESALGETLSWLEQFRQNGHRAFTELLSTLRISAHELQELHGVLLASGFNEEPLTHTTKNCADLCNKLRRELSPSELSKTWGSPDMDQVEVMLSRTCRQITAIKKCADRFSES